jgi:hypothetical protein
VIEAVDVLDAGADLVVVAADDGRAGQRSDPIDHGIRVGPVADEVTQHQDTIEFSRR